MKGTPKRLFFIRLAMFAVFLSVCGVLGKFSFDQYSRRLISDERVGLEDTLNLVGNPVSQIIQRRLTLVSGLEKFVSERSDNKISSDFETFAQGLYNDTLGVRNIGIAPNGVLKYIYPKQGNEAAFGYNLLTDQTPSVKADVTRAIGIKQTVVSDPFELRQGGLGIAARKAIYKSGNLWGLVSVVIDVPTITSGLQNINSLKDFDIALRNKKGEIFWGNKEVFQNNPIIKKIDTVDGYWELGGMPRGGWDASVRDNKRIFLAVELIFALIVGLIITLLWNRLERVLVIKLAWDTRIESLKPAAWYLVFAAVWILFSDQLSAMLFKDPDVYLRVSIVKGWLFVLVTTLLLYSWTTQSFGKLDTLLLFLKKIQSIAKLGYYVLDIKTGMWEGSDVLKDIFGIDDKYKTDVTGWVQVISPDQRREMEDYFKNEVVGKKRPFDKEYKIINKITGKETWVHGMGSLDFDSEGNPVRMLGTIQDITNNKMKELAVIESEAKFKYLFDFMTQGVLLQNSEGAIVDVNLAGIKILGIPKEQLVGKKIEEYGWKIVSEEGKILKSEDLPSRIVTSSGRPVTDKIVGVYFSQNSNKIKWLLINSVPKFVSQVYKPNMTITTFSDITEKKESEDELRRVASFPELNPNAVFEVSKEGLITYQNPVYKKMVADYGKGGLVLLPNDFHELYKKLLKDHGPIIREEKIDGKTYMVTMYIPEGTVDLRFYAEDITERKLAEERLIRVNDEIEEEKQKIETILINLGDAVFAVDEKGIVKLANRAASEITGYQEKDLIGSFCSSKLKLTSEKTGEEVECLVDTVLKKGQVVIPKEPLILTNKEGKSIAIDGVGTPIKDALNRVVGAVIVLRDESKQRSLNKLKTDFVSLASHQLRTPLTGIKWFVELLKENVTKIPPEETSEYVDKIGKSNQRLIDLVNDLLTTSKIEEGVLTEKNLTQTSIKSMIQEAVMAQGNLFIDKNIHLEGVEYIPDDLTVEADKVQMVQVFANILNNAGNYSPSGSRIDVWVEKKNNGLIVFVKDEGAGIPEKQKSKIFDKFFRADNISRNVPGSGLGLYVSKSIVESHGGKIWFESEEGKGTTFFVELLIKQKKDG